LVDILGLINIVDFSIVSAAIGIIIGMFRGIIELRDIKKTRRAELGMRFYEKMTEKGQHRLWVDVVWNQDFSSHIEWLEKNSPQVDPEAASTTFTLLSMYNNAGLLLKEGLVDAGLVFSYIAPITVFRAWKKLEPLVKAWREKLNDPTFYESFEYLYDETSKRYSQMTVFNG
jgi:hypothetical protein